MGRKYPRMNSWFLLLNIPHLPRVGLKYMYIKVSQITGIFQKITLQNATLFHVMPFPKMIVFENENLI